MPYGAESAITTSDHSDHGVGAGVRHAAYVLKAEPALNATLIAEASRSTSGVEGAT